jgi:radical SAM protein with 4Fe4S-binding SPASM domain
MNDKNILEKISIRSDILWRWENTKSILVCYGDMFKFAQMNESLSLVFYLLALGKRENDILKVLKERYGLNSKIVAQIFSYCVCLLENTNLVAYLRVKYPIEPKHYNNTIIAEKSKYEPPKIKILSQSYLNPRSWKSRFRSPLTVYLDVDCRCNQSCSHCFNYYTHENAPQPAPFERICKIIDKLAEGDVFIVALTGGEPLMRTDIFKLAAYILSRRMKAAIFTNGILLGKRIREIGTDKVSFFNVSLEGSKPYIHEKIRNKGSFKVTINGIKKAIVHKVRVQIKMTATKLNWYNVPDTYRLAKKLGVRQFEINTWVPSGISYVNKGRLQLNSLQEKALLIYVRLMRLHNRLTKEPVEISMYPGCREGFSISAVNMNGDLIPCGFIPTVVGSLFNHTLEELWAKLDDIYLKPDKLKGPCKPCVFKYNCFGGCRARHYYDTGDILGGNLICIRGKIFSLANKVPVLHELNAFLLDSLQTRFKRKIKACRDNRFRD